MGAAAGVGIRPVRPDDAWRWLAAGWSDLRRRPALGLGCGLLAALPGYAALACLYWLDPAYLAPPLAAAFVFGGPLIAVGLYEMSRRCGEGGSAGLPEAASAVRRAPPRLSFMGSSSRCSRSPGSGSRRRRSPSCSRRCS